MTEPSVPNSSRRLRLAILCPEVSGHLNPFLTLMAELKSRGHQLTFVGKRDAEQRVRDAGFDFAPIGEAEFPPGSWNRSIERLGQLSGRAALRFTVERYQQSASVLLRDAPDQIRCIEADGLIVDQTITSGATVAELLNLPFVTLCAALPMNEEPGVPTLVFPWRFRPGWIWRMRNRMGHYLFRRVARPVKDAVNRVRRAHGLRPQTTTRESFSRWAQIAQMPQEFDFPRSDLPESFHYVGPLHDTGDRPAVDFPYERLTGRSLIYASMGTLQNRLQHVFQIIAEACQGIDAQLVLSQGGGDNGKTTGFPGDPIVVPFAPQLELLKRAAITITHAGMNTTIESLAQGVPLVAVPVTNDQPGVAARIEWTGAGAVVPLGKITVPTLRDAVGRVLSEQRFRSNAERLKQAIAQTGGVAEAADIIETAVRTRQPVLRESTAQSAAVGEPSPQRSAEMPAAFNRR